MLIEKNASMSFVCIKLLYDAEPLIWFEGAMWRWRPV